MFDFLVPLDNFGSKDGIVGDLKQLQHEQVDYKM